ncbi:hypothetical protein Y600_5939 [Burkholderia pseudomallei MSHR3709]|nr:hypothetical protein Y600_5939 [Burkholderia pseudomallei MSHR3709]
MHCHELACLDTVTGSWRSPYFSTELGIGFSGACFEAMSIIALFQRCVGQLVDEGGVQSRPSPDGLANMLITITERWFKQHRYSNGMKVEFLLFGFSPLDGSPWVKQITRTSESDVSLTYSSVPLGPDETYLIGDVTNELKNSLEDIRARIFKHARNIKPQSDLDSIYEMDLAHARHLNADKKTVEHHILQDISSEYRATVGGVLQKMEVHDAGDGRGHVAFSRNMDLEILDFLPPVGARLCFVPVTEKMGWSS